MPEHVRRAILVCVLFIQAIAETGIAINALGVKMDPSNYLSCAIGLLFIVMGTNFRKLQWNFFGLRKNIFSDVVSEKAYRAGRWTFIASGIGIIGVTFIMPQEYKALGGVNPRYWNSNVHWTLFMRGIANMTLKKAARFFQHLLDAYE